MPDPEPVRHFTLGGLLHKNIIIKKHWPFAPALTAAKYACCNSARDTGTYISYDSGPWAIIPPFRCCLILEKAPLAAC